MSIYSIDDDLIRSTKMDSISSVAIRNLGPSEIDINDPDQRKLIEQMDNMHGNIWGYSDNQPWFLAGLNKADPHEKRQAIETMVLSIKGSQEHIMGFASSGDIKNKKPIANKKVTYNRPPPAISLERTRSEDRGDGAESELTAAPKEMKMIIKKTVELVGDMAKSVQLVYHAIRALARFMSYPTPSIPSYNYVFGHAKGWIWLIYKGLAKFQPTCNDILLSNLLKRLHKAMSHLASESYLCSQEFGKFHDDLKKLNASVRKEAKSLKSQGHLWTVKIDAYLQFADELKKQRQILIDTEEDRPFPSDWGFEPYPSRTGFLRDFFHFQWIKTKNNWATDEFEFRSDYSTRWFPYTDLKAELQMELLFYIIEHFTAIIDECRNFVKCNMHLTFDYDEIKCLNFAIAEIHAEKESNDTVELIGNLTTRLFEDMALLLEISHEFMENLDWVSSIIEPCYETVQKLLKPDEFLPLQFDGRILSPERFCCGCLVRSHLDFLGLYGDPMEAVLLRTPISSVIVEKFFSSDYLVNHDLIHMPSANINAFGVSEGYTPSIFDNEIGRNPPKVTPKKLPKFRRRGPVPDKGFNIGKLKDYTDAAIRKKDGKVDTEIYLKIIEQIKRFLQTVGPALSFMVSEVTERFERLDTLLYTELSDYYESLENIVEHEMSSGILDRDPLTSGTRAFRRLNGVLLFFALFIEDLSQLEAGDVPTYSCRTAYYKSYSKYHSWFVQKTSTYSMHAIPIKNVLYLKIAPDKTLIEIDSIFSEFVPQAMIVYDRCQTLFETKEIPDF